MDTSDPQARRQSLMLRCLLEDAPDPASLGTRDDPARSLRGWQVYRANADASAERALATAFPTLRMLIGEEDFAHLAREFRRADPPVYGDLGEWGGGLPAWIEAQERLAAWPYLGDCARLDWAVHRCERSMDSEVEAASFARLGDTDPARLVLELAPGLTLVDSAWPIGMIHAAHRSADEPLGPVREAIARQRGEAVVVARQGWKAVATVVDAETARWTAVLIEGIDLARALDAAPEGFDFSAWLATALRHGWLRGICILDAGQAPSP